jgi:superoxide dismutase, Fe-Mn family
MVKTGGTTMPFELPKLEFAFDALEPHIDTKTVEIHYSKHHQAYVDKLNAALAADEKLAKKKAPFDMKDVDELLRHIDFFSGATQLAVQNNGGGHANHCLYWSNLGPASKSAPSAELGKAIDNVFGTLDNFKKKFSDTGVGRFGSGWVFLVFTRDKKLDIMSTPNQDSPLMLGHTPLLALDVWEHAYYLKYMNRRADHIAAWWNVVNWKNVSERFEKAKKQ